MRSNAVQEYRVRLDARRVTLAALITAEARLAHARLAVFFSAVVLALLAWRSTVSLWWLLAPGAVFVWLVRRHVELLRARSWAARGTSFYERGLARLEDRWAGTGDPGERFRDDRHVYANDLNLFGRGSLFELLSLARTRTGEATLAGWLTAAAEPLEIRARQTAVQEFAFALDLREQLALSGVDFDSSVNTERLVDWAEAPMPSRRTLRAVVSLFTASTVVAIVYLGLTSAWWPLTAIMLVHAVTLRQFRDDIDTMLSARKPGAMAGVVGDVLTHRSRDLDAVAELLTNLERAHFTDSRLVLLHSRLTGAGGLPASRIIRQMERLSAVHDSQTNAAVIPLGLFIFGGATGQGWISALALMLAGLLLLVRPHLALAVERWRRRHGRQVRVWIEAVAQFEALSSLAAYRYEHQDDPFPEIVTPGTGHAGALFDGVQLGHPLLPRAVMVPNDVRFVGETRLLVVSGSNMSGKSTLLRTVGINTVLALAGAPVRARSLRLSPLAVGATIQIRDSLLEGRSRFYAEITRIRALADIASGPVPLLFLLDELFHGTNSNDRLLGAKGVLRNLIDRGALGLITTHDLALSAMADELAPRAVNVHFRDSFEEGAITFDYRMQSGPVTRSNALALMRAVGLEIGSLRSPS